MSLNREPELPLRVIDGATLSRTFAMTDRATGVDTDLTGWTPSMVVYNSDGTVAFTFTTSNGINIATPSSGEIHLEFLADSAAADPAFNLARGSYHYRVFLTNGLTVWALWPGTLEVAAP